MDTVEVTLETGRVPGCWTSPPPRPRFVAGKGDGLLSVFLPHATAGLAIVETGAGSDGTSWLTSRPSSLAMNAGGTATAPPGTGPTT